MATTFSWTDNGETVSVIMEATTGNIYATGSSIDAVFPACIGRSTSNIYPTVQRKFALLLEENGLEFQTPYSAVFSGSGTKSATIPASRPKNTGELFNTSNRTTRSVTFTYKVNAFITWVGDGDAYYWPDSPKTIYTATVILDVPPTINLGTPIYATPYAGVGAYNVPITSASAAYGGRISKVTLTVGQDSTVQTYSATTISNQTISVIPTIAGTYTPTITIEDSRGQTTTNTLPQITVNPYNIPSASFDVYRTNDIGIKNDEGHYALIQSTISYTDAIATLREPSIQIDEVDLSSLTDASVTWYKTWSNTSGVSSVISDWTTLVPQNHMVTIYGLIDWDYDTTGNFAEDTSYQITLVANDSLSGQSTPITQTMSTAFYTIDFRAGGKEIAFGGPANDSLVEHPNGLFKCNMDAWFNGNVIGISGSLVGEIKAYAGATVPNGWLECDGSEVAIADYPLLYDAIQNLWGTPSDSDHFILPNMKGKVPVGQDTSATPDTDFDTVGETGGAKTVTLTANQSGVKAHGHGFNANFYVRHGKDSGTTWGASGTNVTYGTGGYSSQWAGGGSITSYKHYPDKVSITGGVANATATNASEAHTNLQPYAVVKYIICTGE